MKKNLALALFYTKPNKYSFNAIAGALETDVYFDNLSIYFINKEKDLIPSLDNIIDQHDFVVLGVSFFTTQLWDIKNVVTQLKTKYSNKLIYIAGGPHPSGDPLGTVKMGFDVVVRGEGEGAIKDIMKAIDNDSEWSSIKGIAYIDKDHKYQYTGRRSYINLDDYPPFAVKNQKFGPIEITRGCPYVCHFCQTPRLFGTKLRHRSIARICDYVSIMKSKNLTDIRVITPNSFSYGSIDGKTVDVPKLRELLSAIRAIIGDTGRIFFGSFPSEVRPEHVTEETLNLVLEYANNDNLVIGGQSGSQRILDLCHRGHSVADIYNSVRLTLNAGLKANVDFIFGLPGETADDAYETVIVMNDLVEMGAIIHTHTFMPLPQTPYENSKPGHIDDDLRKIINKLVSTKAAYGNWREQEKIAKKMASYLRNIKHRSNK